MTKTTTDTAVCKCTETVECIPNKNEKTVSFLSTVEAYPCLHIDDYSLEEKRACWLSRKEMSYIKKEVRETIEFISESVFIAEEDSEVCSRGLEAFMPQQSAARRQRRHDAIKSVLEEQQTQRDSNEEFDADFIAEAYEQFTPLSISVAQNIAKKNAEFVLEERARELTCANRRNAIYRKTSRSLSSTRSQHGSKRRLISQGAVVCVH